MNITGKYHKILFLFILLPFSGINSQWLEYKVSIPDSGEYYINDINFADASHGFAAGKAHNFYSPPIYWGVVLVTSDGGTTWNAFGSQFAKTMNSLDVVSPLIVYACGDSGLVARTTNGGLSWLTINTPAANIQPWSVYFLNPSTGYITSSATQTYKTTDAGITWQLMTAAGFDKIVFTDAANCLGMIKRQGIYRSTNGGVNWSNPVSDSLITDFTFREGSSNEAWCFSAPSAFNPAIKGSERKSTDGGVTWNLVYANDPSGRFTRVKFFDSNTGYANNFWGSPSGVSKTTNGGVSWFNPTNLRYNFTNLFFANVQTGWANGNIQTFCKTTNGPGTFVNPYFAPLEVYHNSNNISDRISGTSFCSPPNSVNGGFEWPKGSGKYLTYTAGLTLGAKIDNIIAVSYPLYNNDFNYGHISSGGSATGSELGEYGVYTIKTGDGPGTPAWDNWPIWQGAPANGNTPQLQGNMTSFASVTDGYHNTYSAVPMNAEVKMTTYSFNSPAPYDDILFVKYIITNRSGFTWDSAYFSVFADADVGASDDDKMGSDKSLNLSYAYNGTNNDAIYGAAPPAVGIKVLRSPLNDHLSNAIMFYNGGFPCQSDPNQGYQIFNYLKGLDRCGSEFTNQGNPVHYLYDGDPETNTGWNMSEMHDVRITVTAGPVTLANNLSTEFTFAVIVARGSSNLNSVTKLKQIAATLPIAIEPISSNIPTRFALYQNYPNPFNPETKIKISIPPLKGESAPLVRRGMTIKTQQEGVSVKLYIFNLLGQEVADLVNSPLAPGEYEIPFNASHLASGVYFARLTYGNLSDVKKMVMIK